MTETVEQIVHESEAQRQFVRVRLPAEVLFDGSTHNVRDLSSGGIGIMDVPKSYSAGSTVELTLTLPFQDFSMDIDLRGHVQAYNAQTKVLGIRFTDLTKQQISLLNHILKSYISGDIVAGPDLLNVVARDNFVKIRKQNTGPASAPDLIRQSLPLFFITVLGTMAALFVGSNIIENVLMIKANNAVVEAESVSIVSPADGRYENNLPEDTVTVKVGEVLGMVDGKPVTSPCDCMIQINDTKDGQMVTAGKPLMTLLPMEQNPTISVRIEPAAAQRLKMNNPVTLSVAGSDLEFTGRIVSITSSLSAPETAILPGLQTSYAIVKVKPSTKLPVDLAGRPAQVLFKVY